MSYLRSFFGGGGGDNGGRHEDDGGAEIVERLVERVQTSTTFEDRRDALKALRSLAKKYRLEVGSMCFPALVGILENDQNHSELLSMALDTLAVVITECDENDSDDDTDELGEKFAQIFIKDKRPVSMVLQLLDSYEFSIRRPIIQLLTGLLRHRANEVQNILMQDPMAISRLLDLLQESREVLRNDAVLMLSELTRGNPQIQKLVAYENAFQLLFDVIGHENSDSIVIEDCLFVILSLLRKNPSNQQLFREASLIQRLAYLLNSLLNPSVSDEEGAAANGTAGTDEEWSKQKTANVIFVFQVIRSLVSHENPVANILAAQKVMHKCEILQNLCAILLSEMGVSVEVLTEAVIAVAEVIRGCQKNQDYFASMSLVNPHEPQPRSAILVLLQSMTSEKQPFKLRCAVLYCFQAFLYRNEFGKTKVIETLLPASADSGQAMSAGHYLCSALISNEPVQVWFGCVSVMHCVLEAPHLKEQLLRVQLATSLGEAPMSLLQQICALLVSLGNRRPQTRAGLLMLLAVWLHECPVAVAHFLHKDDNIQYLTSHIDEGTGEGSESENQVVKGLCAFVLAICLQGNDDSVEKNNRTSLTQVIERRVGRDMIAERLEEVSKSEQYVRAAQRPQLSAKIPPELLLDYEFTKLFKALEGDLVRLLRPAGAKGANGAAPSIQHEAIIASYKELIKRQDDQISSLMQQVRRLQSDLEQERAAAEQTKLQATPPDAVDRLRAELAEKCRLLDERSQVDTAASAQSTAQLQVELQQMTVVAQQWQAEATRYQQFAEQWQQYQLAQLPNPVDEVVTTLRTQHEQLEQQLGYGWQAFEQQGQQLIAVAGEKAAVEAQLAAVQQQLHDARAELERIANNPPPPPAPVFNPATSSSQEEVASLKKEQEDLLVLLADQDSKLREYRRRLVVYGDSVTDEDDEESADEEAPHHS